MGSFLRRAAVGALLGGCAEDPLVANWHHPIALEQTRRGDGSCDAPLHAEDLGPYAFLAVSTGVPDIASVYLCDGPEDCPDEPAGSIWIESATRTELRGQVGSSSLLGNLCTVSWNGLVATREGERIHLELELGNSEIATSNPDECDDQLRLVIGEVCDSVLVLDGVQE